MGPLCLIYLQKLSVSQYPGAPSRETQQLLQQELPSEQGSPTARHTGVGGAANGPANPRRAASAESLATVATTTPALSPSMPVNHRRRFERLATALVKESNFRSSIIERPRE